MVRLLLIGTLVASSMMALANESVTQPSLPSMHVKRCEDFQVTGIDCDGPKPASWDWARVGPSFHDYRKYGVLIFE